MLTSNQHASLCFDQMFPAIQRFRKSDPVTSKMAAVATEKFAKGHAGIILECLKKHGPQTADEIAKHTTLNSVKACRRLPELQKAGMARPTGNMRLSASGHPEREWEAC